MQNSDRKKTAGGLADTPTYGVELEKTFSRDDGEPYAVGEGYFKTLEALKKARGENAKVKSLGGRTVAVATERGEEGLDNGFNLGESATGPIREDEGGLAKLNEAITRELKDVHEALKAEGAGVVNMSNHPMVEVNEEAYRRFVVPKPVYSYLVHGRHWDHMAGIDAKSQNSPSTGVSVRDAVPALNAVLAFGPAFIALYANSPFEAKKVSGMQESRMMIWERMFAGSISEGDRNLCRMPQAPFRNLREYFRWMFGPGTNMLFVIESSDSSAAKKSDRLIVIDGNPSILDFLKGKEWMGRVFGTEEHVRVVPRMAHLELHQFVQFAGARIRFGIHDTMTVGEFLEAMEGSGDEVETLFERCGKFFYIEGRDIGANFPDRSTYELPRGELVARSVVISPSALQAGLVRNAGKVNGSIAAKYRWADLRGLREEAVRKGLSADYQGVEVKRLCDMLLQAADEGLQEGERWMLAYPESVLSSGMNGADRALRSFERETGGTVAERIRRVVAQRLWQLGVKQ